VSLGTLRIVLLTRGIQWQAGLVGFFQAITWVIAAGQVINNLEDPVRIVAFAAGFAGGTVLGVMVERWLAVGMAILRVVAPVDSPQVAGALREQGFGVTVLNGEGRDGEVRLTFTVIPRRMSKAAVEIIRVINPDAFVILEEVRTAEPRYRKSTEVRS
jgi:uncharacterized protein YebE (UPF0316 family)